MGGEQLTWKVAWIISLALNVASFIVGLFVV
jgi:hypothetical protein